MMLYALFFLPKIPLATRGFGVEYCHAGKEVKHAKWEGETQGNDSMSVHCLGIRFSAEARSLQGVSEGTKDGTGTMTWD